MRVGLGLDLDLDLEKGWDGFDGFLRALSGCGGLVLRIEGLWVELGWGFLGMGDGDGDCFYVLGCIFLAFCDA